MLDVAVLLDAFQEANRLSRTTAEYVIQMVANDVTQNLASHDGFRMQATASFEDCLHSVDTLFFVGYDPGVEIQERSQILRWLGWHGPRSRRLASVASGTLLLAEAGLLNGRRATTHWQYQEQLSTRYPRVRLERDVIYVRDANIYTCAGATSGLDLALSMIEEDLGAAVAAQVAQTMLVSFRRSGAAPQISATLRAQQQQAGPIANLLSWLPDNLQQDLSIRKLARRSAMSPRNFARTFRREVGLTPAKHIENLRLEAARFRLESSSLTVDGVAFATGFESSETLRRLFVRRLGITPGRYRAERARSERSAPIALPLSDLQSETRVLNSAS
jgi:transcriptional regulator GlxA family with amidase domain